MSSVRYAIAVFASACLLFQVQPLIAKTILPWFGGSAAVWTASLLFFQLALLAGYGYAHASIRWLRPRTQVVVHCALLVVSCIALPIAPAASWRPTEPGDPTFRILGLLGATIGPPYLVLASTTPLLQTWFARRTGAALPYRLFAVSNFGSLVALVGYPIVVEPRLTTHQQASAWSAGYVGFVVVCAIAALASFRSVEPAPIRTGARARPSQIALWVMLAACPSALLVSISNHISQNVAAIPLLWVVPLALYLVSFVAVFDSDRVYRRGWFLPLLAIALVVMARLIYADGGNLNLRWVVPGFALGLLVCCMVCHGELARRRPTSGDSTAFYLAIASGGALGGVFVAAIAPRVFDAYYELPLALVGCGILATIAAWNMPVPKLGVVPLRIVLVGGTVLLACYLVAAELHQAARFKIRIRNFYGVLQVRDEPDAVPAKRTLVNGTISHGSQLLDPARRCTPTSYYGELSGVGRAIRALRSRGPLELGVIGLGAGVLASYGRPGDHFRIYEIDPLDEMLARSQFSFLTGCPGDKTVVLGDARVTLEALPPQGFDLLAVDAFSGDAIPVHLLTREAFELYFRHLKPGGVLAVHISNDYLDLEPICARAAELLGRRAMVFYDRGDPDGSTWSSKWVLMTSDASVFASDGPAANGQPLDRDDGRVWTDDYSNLLEVLSLP